MLFPENLLNLDTPVKEAGSLDEALASLVTFNKSLQVNYGHESIALELINFGDAVKYLKNLAAKVKLVNKFTKEEVKFLPLINHTPSKALFVSDYFKDLDFTEVRKVQIYKPIGLSSTFLELTDLLETHKDLFLNLEKLALIPYTRYIRQVIEDPTEVVGIPRELTRLPEAEKIDKQFGKLFGDSAGVDVIELGKAVHRLKDFDTLAVKVDELTNEFSKVDRDSIFKSMEILVASIDELITMFQKHEDYKPSKGFVTSLADQTTLIAGLTASYSLYSAKLIAIDKAAKDNVVRIKEVTEKIKK